MKNLKCAITGASGYLGLNVAQFLNNHGCEIYEMGRKSTLPFAHAFIPFKLGANQVLTMLSNVDVLIHFAYDFSTTSWQEIKRINIDGTLDLFREAKRLGVKKIIFISTMSAYNGTKSNYGKAKLQIENSSNDLDVITIRPGLVFGNNTQGILGKINKLIAIFPIIPIIGFGNQILYPCNVNDLARAIFSLINMETIPKGVITAAANQPLKFKEILLVLAASHNKKIILFPIPYNLIYYGFKVLEKLHLNLGLRSDSLVGLNYSDPNPDFSLTNALNLTFRELNSHTFKQ